MFSVFWHLSRHLVSGHILFHQVSPSQLWSASISLSIYMKSVKSFLWPHLYLASAHICPNHLNLSDVHFHSTKYVLIQIMWSWPLQDWSADEDDSDSDSDSQSNDREKVTNTSLTPHTPTSLTAKEAARAVDRDSGVVNTPESLLDEKMAAVAVEIAPQYWTGRTRYRATDATMSGCDDASSLSRLWWVCWFYSLLDRSI